MNSVPAVCIVLVNWNDLPNTRECLWSLADVRYGKCSVIVVDNGSRADDAAQIRAEFPSVTVLETGRNLGFTGGNNVGIRHALADGADYVLCLNTDTTVAPDFLSLLVDALEADPTAGIATSAIFYADPPDRLSALGCQIRPDAASVTCHIADVDAAQLSAAGAVDVPFAEGCVLLMRRVVAEQTGGFDDAFFAYNEDADLCLRARARGWRCVAIPRARVWHKIGGSTGGANSPTAIYYCRRNAWRLLRRHGTSAERRTMRAMQRTDLALRWRWFFADCIRVPRFWEQSVGRQSLRTVTAGITLGVLGCSGPRSKWRGLEAAVNIPLSLLMGLGLAIGALLHPLYCLCRTCRKRFLLKT